MRHGIPLLRVPADYEKYFNTVQLAEADAVMHCAGVPDCARRLYMEVFRRIKVRLSTRVGMTRFLDVLRGIV